MSTPHRIPVGLSASSCYPHTHAYTFDVAERLGYDGVEVMVWHELASREAGAMQSLSEHHGLPILSVHAPTLLFLQHVWGSPWEKIDRTVELAETLGAPAVVIHPPFAWQRDYATGFVDGIAQRQERTDVHLCVENMYPWRARMHRIEKPFRTYRPHWDPTLAPYARTCLDLSHTATAGSDALAMARTLGSRLSHIHLADGTGSVKDEHLVPGRGAQPCAEVLQLLPEIGFTGSVVLEVGTRSRSHEDRMEDLRESLAFARTHLGQSGPGPTASECG